MAGTTYLWRLIRVCRGGRIIEQGFGNLNLNTGNNINKCNTKGVGKMGREWNDKLEWNGVCGIIHEKKSKRGSCLSGS